MSALLPYPNHIEQREGTFSISANELIVINSNELIFAANELQYICSQWFGIELPTGESGKIRLILNE